MGLFDSDDDSLREMNQTMDRNREMYDLIKLPEYAEYIPELYGAESYNYDLIGEDPQVKSDQLSLLKRMAGLSETGESDADEADYIKASQVGNQIARGNREATIQDAQSRGVSGGGLEFAMREMANQSGAQRAQELGLQKASDASARRMKALEAYSQGLSGVRDQDYRSNASNTNIINDFNRANTQQRNAVSQANVDSRNESFKYNEGLKDKNYSNQVGRADRIAGINNQQAEMTAAQQEAERRRRSGLMGAIGAGVGGVVGGPTGAGVGYSVGSNIS